MTLYRKIRRAALHLFLKFRPLYFANKEFRNVFDRNMDVKHPKNLVEKFYWLMLNADLTLMAQCADKYRVREFVKERGCGEILNELYAVWHSPEDISFDQLPDSFILKMNNGSGDVTIVKDKRTASLEDIKAHFRAQWDKEYGFSNAQLHYCKIKPCIIAEKLLSDHCPFSSSLVDYKVWCFDGKVESIWVAYERKKEYLYMDLKDTHWNSLESHLNSCPHYQYHPENKIPKPQTLDQMLHYASVLSKGFPEVRVDFYEIDGKVVFGELTFTTGYGYFKREYYDYLGSKTILPIDK
jgi:hypothetical protein